MKCSGKLERDQTTIRLPAGLKRELQREACEKNLSFNSYVLILIDKARQLKCE